ncbi:unnamed protein product [Closterium sp. NIES-54]
MEESDSEEEQNGVQGEELIGGSVAVKVSATLGQAMWETWHRRLAYVVVSTLEVMHKEKCVHGPQLQGDGASVGSSEACMQNKSARFPFPRAEGSAHLPLEVVQMDLVGPMRTEGTGGVLYFLTMVDKWSCLTWARPLSKKSGAAAAIKEDWLQMVEWQVMWLVNVLRSDHGGEFLGAEFTKFLRRNGIRHQLTCPGTPQQNGIAEHANRTIGEAAKTLLGAAGMPYKFWPEAVRHIITVNNRVLTHIGDNHWVPYERWLGKKPSIDMLREWQHQQPVQIGLRLQEIERSAVEEVQLHLEDLPGSELTSDHSGGAEQQGADPATEDGLEDESAHLDSPSQLKLGATAKVTKRREIFAPVAKLVTLRTLPAGAAVKGWYVKQVDTTTAFLNGVLLEDIYMAQPDSYEDGTSRVCKLMKAIYGLKQVPTCWYEKMEEVLLGGSFKMFQADHCLFLLGEWEQLLLLLVYVDDILLFSPSMEQIERTQKLLMDNFKCKMLGDVHY